MANNQSVRRHLMLLPEVESLGSWRKAAACDKCGCRVRIAHSIVSQLWRQFQTTRTAIQGLSSGRPRGTTPAEGRYIVLQARRNRRQTAREIARHTTQAAGRPISRFTVARRLHGGGLFARRPRHYGLQFLFMDDNAPCHRTVAAGTALRERLAARTLPPVTIRELRLALQDEWAAMPQQLIDTLILSLY
ncbi:transposable element Tcb1 transposase [Trichonephila clavipes]|nr:transposable element Tcb1 transposase [Trichonephila clavipes]